jgi:hypothetical protein
MSNPEWLNQVQAVPAGAGTDGKSETGAALSAIADAMCAEDQVVFAAGEVMGVVIERIAFAQHAIAVSTGDAAADIQRLAQMYDVDWRNISLVPAAAMLNEQFQGTAGCLQLPTAPVDKVGHGRVTLDKLEYLLQLQRAEGVPGSTVVAVSGLDNNGRSGVANFEVLPRTANVAKAEFEKPWTIAKFVSRGGVMVLVLG